MKRILGIMLTLVLLCSACPAQAASCGAADALLEQLAACLAVSDRACAIRMDAWRKIQAFCEQRDYAALVDARLACDQAQEQLKALSAPALTLSPDALQALMLTGVPTDALEAELERLALSLPDMLGSMGFYERMLYVALLDSDRVDMLAQQASMDQRSEELMMEYQCVLVNALLLPLADQPQVAAFWTEIPARYPTLGGCQPPWEPEQAALEEHFLRLDRAYTAQADLSAELLGRDAYATDQYNRAADQADADALKEHALTVGGMPPMLPLPEDWLAPEASTAFVYTESPEGLPKLLTLQAQDVPLDRFEDYVQQLLRAGATLHGRKGSDGEGWLCALLYDGQGLMLEWAPTGCVSITWPPASLSLELGAYCLLRR